MGVDIYIISFLTTWLLGNPFKNQQLMVTDRMTPSEAWTELRRKDPMLPLFEEVVMS
jgi:hypothetical protein